MEANNVTKFPLIANPGKLTNDIDAVSREAYGPPNFDLLFLPVFRYPLLVVVALSGFLAFAISCGLFGPPVQHVIEVAILWAVFLVSGVVFVATYILKPKAV